jgi:hypothetical protein
MQAYDPKSKRKEAEEKEKRNDGFDEQLQAKEIVNDQEQDQTGNKNVTPTASGSEESIPPVTESKAEQADHPTQETIEIDRKTESGINP